MHIEAEFTVDRAPAQVSDYIARAERAFALPLRIPIDGLHTAERRLPL